jgi:hypothetical protein
VPEPSEAKPVPQWRRDMRENRPSWREIGWVALGATVAAIAFYLVTGLDADSPWTTTAITSGAIAGTYPYLKTRHDREKLKKAQEEAASTETASPSEEA